MLMGEMVTIAFVVDLEVTQLLQELETIESTQIQIKPTLMQEQ